MPNVTQTVPNYLGGVSRQPDTKKMPGQVVDAINAYPDPTFGLTKRPGLNFLKIWETKIYMPMLNGSTYTEMETRSI